MIFNDANFIFSPPFCFTSDQAGKSEAYLEAIRKNIEWLKKHSREEGKEGEASFIISADEDPLLFSVISSAPQLQLIHSLFLVLPQSFEKRRRKCQEANSPLI